MQSRLRPLIACLPVWLPLAVLPAAAQPPAAAADTESAGAVVSGAVLDGATGAPIPGAAVTSGAETTETDADGRFTVTLAAGDAALRIAADGYLDSPWWNPASHRERRGARLTRREEGAYWAYATDEQRRQAGCIAARMQRGLSPRAVEAAAAVDPAAPAPRPALEVLLFRNTFAETVEVVSPRPALERPSATPVEAGQVLAVAGALDNVFRTLNLPPEVAATGDFSSRLAVRGGTPDQNLTVMDGVEIHNPYRLFGLVGAFNPETVERFELAAGGFAARGGTPRRTESGEAPG